MEQKSKNKVVQRGYTFNKGSTFKHRGFCLEVWSVSMEDNQQVICDSV